MVTASDAIDALTTTAASSSSSEGEGGERERELLYERDRLEAVKQAATALMTAVSSPGSIGFLVSELSKLMEHESDVRRRRWGCYLAEQLFRCSRAPYGDLVPVLLKNLLSRVAETDRALLQAVSEYCQRRDTQCRITQHIRIIHNTPSHNTPSLLTRHPLITPPTIMTLPPSLPYLSSGE